MRKCKTSFYLSSQRMESILKSKPCDDAWRHFQHSKISISHMWSGQDQSEDGIHMGILASHPFPGVCSFLSGSLELPASAIIIRQNNEHPGEQVARGNNAYANLTPSDLAPCSTGFMNQLDLKISSQRNERVPC